MSNLAIIPARGGSKRIPRKNIRNFLGAPLIKYSIDAAKRAKCFDEIMVSTDDDEIARVAKKYGAKIPFMRSRKNSSDKAVLVDVMIEVIEEYKKLGRHFDYFCCITPTAPLIDARRLELGFEILKKKNADEVMTVVSFSYPIQRAFRIKGGRLKMIWPENINKNSQDFEKTYHDAGQFYWLKTDSFIKQKRLFAKDTIALEIPESEAQDIDVEEDLKIAKLKYNLLSGRKKEGKNSG